MFFDFNKLIPAELQANTSYDYLVASSIVIGSVILLYLIKYVIIKRAKKLAKSTKSKLDDAVVATLNAFNWPFYLVVGLYIASFFLELPGYMTRWGSYIILIVVAYYGTKAVNYLIDYGFKRSIAKHKEAEEDYNDTTMGFVGRLLKGILWLIAGILVLQNLGYEITTLVAGLGVGGVAIAFALQSVLTDIFASFSIYFDKPFKVGDYIEIGKDNGTVKKIGIKSTRLETLQGEELVISNQELTEARVRNFKKMDKRRSSFKLEVAYETSQEKLQQIPQFIKEIINNTQNVEIDRITFNEFGESGIIFEIIYYLGTRDFSVFRKTQSGINYAIKEKFDHEGIEMPYPTRNVYMKNS